MMAMFGRTSAHLCKLATIAMLGTLVTLGVGNAAAAVNDVAPGDYFPLAKGTTTLAVYAYKRATSGPYVNGRKTLDGEVDMQILALRAGHFFELGGHPLSVIAVLPWARAEVAPATLAGMLGKEASGMGDLRLGATSWLMADREQGRYLGLSALVNVPTGDYDHRQVANIGENRSKLTLSLGWIQPLTKSLVFELTPEVAWYGDNDDYVGNTRLTQRHSLALTSYLRYRATPNWQFHVGAQGNHGGATRINGVDQNNAPDNPRVMLGTTFNSDNRKHQWIVRLARDTRMQNGFKTDRELLVRYLWMY